MLKAITRLAPSNVFLIRRNPQVPSVERGTRLGYGHLLPYGSHHFRCRDKTWACMTPEVDGSNTSASIEFGMA